MDGYQHHGILKIIFLSIQNHKMFNFMFSLLILLILSALLEDYKYSHFVLNSLTTIVIIAGVYVASGTKTSIYISSILALPWFLSSWFFMFETRSVFFSFFLFTYVTMILFDSLIKTKEVTINTLYTAVCVYLMLGLLWACIYGLINELVPGSIFSGSISDGTITANEIIYLSFTTLTTLGYGDFTLTSPVGRIMTSLEAIIGQLFLAFLVARFVAIYASKSISRG